MRAVTETAARRGTTIQEEVADADIVVTSYTLARLEAEQWNQVCLGGVVIDEAQAVKTLDTAPTVRFAILSRPGSLAVSGTPIENSLGDLVVVAFLDVPGLLPPWERPAAVRRPSKRADRRCSGV